MSVISIGFLTVVVGTLLFRFFKNMLIRRRSAVISRNITGDTGYAEAMCEQLDTSVAKKKVQSVNTIEKQLPQTVPFQMGDFTVKQWKKVDATKYLFVTLAKYEDFVKDARGNNYKSTKYFDLNFKIVVDAELSEICVYSDLYDNLVDKNLRRDFVNALMSHLEAAAQMLQKPVEENSI